MATLIHLNPRGTGEIRTHNLRDTHAPSVIYPRVLSRAYCRSQQEAAWWQWGGATAPSAARLTPQPCQSNLVANHHAATVHARAELARGSREVSSDSGRKHADVQWQAGVSGRWKRLLALDGSMETPLLMISAQLPVVLVVIWLTLRTGPWTGKLPHIPCDTIIHAIAWYRIYWNKWTGSRSTHYVLSNRKLYSAVAL